MARTNFENDIYTHESFPELLLKVGNIYLVKGYLVHAWEIAQKYWLEFEAVPKDKWPAELNCLVETGFARTESREDGEFVYVAGSRERFAFLNARVAAGQKGGMAKSAAKQAAAEAREEHKQAQAKASKAKQTKQSLTSLPSYSLSGSYSESVSYSESEDLVDSYESTSTVVEKSTPLAVAKVESKNLFIPKNEGELILGLRETSKSRWAQLYPDETFIRREVLKAFNWYENNPKKKPKTVRGWTAALSSWFERSWPRHLKTIESNKVVGFSDAEMADILGGQS